MSTFKQTKINQLLQAMPTGVVLSSSWLTKQGYSVGLVRNYRDSNWLESFGGGANIRFQDKVDYLGGIFAIQKQLQLEIHPGGRTALALVGRVHYLEINQSSSFLFGQEREVLPTWFRSKQWEVDIKYFASSFLPTKLGLMEYSHKNFSIQISTPARAMMECIFLAPKSMNLIECYDILEGLTNLNPKEVQDLLENCRSIKVKRLFLYLAEKANHTWFHHLRPDKIDLGKGKRSFSVGGVYLSKYLITVPAELEVNEQPDL